MFCFLWEEFFAWGKILSDESLAVAHSSTAIYRFIISAGNSVIAGNNLERDSVKRTLGWEEEAVVQLKSFCFAHRMT